MVRSLLFVCVLLLLLTSSTLAAPAHRSLQGYDVRWGGQDVLTNADFAGFAKSGVDTICMMSHIGSPSGDEQEITPLDPENSFNGDFQDDFGLPAWDDWYCVDYTQATGSAWHVATYNCANLDLTITPNHAWWCGEDLPSCGGGDPAGGYGNSYDERLDYWAEVTNDLAPTSIDVSAVLNYDNETGYDYLYLKYETVGGMQNAAEYNGADTGLSGNINLSFAVGDYVPHPDTGNPSCHIRWHGTSDGAWSEADCDYPTVGLAQMDNITVSGDNGVVTAFEDNEDADPADNLWRISLPQGVGAFCWTWGLLDEIDYCCRNNSPQIAFVDDGNVVPGTGGTMGLSWNYGPNGYVVNPVGGLARPQERSPFSGNPSWARSISRVAMAGPLNSKAQKRASSRYGAGAASTPSQPQAQPSS